MKILILNPYNPFPVNSGGKMRTLLFTAALKEKHQISLLYPPDPDRMHEDILSEEIRRNFQNLWTSEYEIKKADMQTFPQRLKNVMHGIPWEIYHQYLPNFEQMLIRVVRKHSFDIVFARYISTGRYLLENRKTLKAKIIIDVDDLEFIKSSRQLRIEGKKKPYDAYRRKFNNWLLKRYNRKLNTIARTIVCSEHDQHLLQKKLGLHNVTVIPNSIDVTGYTSITPYSNIHIQQKTLLFCGTLNYEPNIDGVVWFIHHVFPLIISRYPTVKLHIVGSLKKGKIRGLADNKSIFCFYNVPDVTSYYEQSSIVIVPLRVGGGTRIKILEAFACRRPVVSTSVGAEGIQAHHDRHLLIADKPEEFADVCLHLLDNPNEAYRLTEEAYRLVSEHYDTRIVNKHITELFEKGIESPVKKCGWGKKITNQQ